MSDNKTLEQEYENKNGHPSYAKLIDDLDGYFGGLENIPLEVINLSQAYAMDSRKLSVENAEQAKRIAELEKRWQDAIKTSVEIETELNAEREKNKRPDCQWCENISSNNCLECKWRGGKDYYKDTRNYKEENHSKD